MTKKLTRRILTMLGGCLMALAFGSACRMAPTSVPPLIPPDDCPLPQVYHEASQHFVETQVASLMAGLRLALERDAYHVATVDPSTLGARSELGKLLQHQVERRIVLSNDAFLLLTEARNLECSILRGTYQGALRDRACEELLKLQTRAANFAGPPAQAQSSEASPNKEIDEARTAAADTHLSFLLAMLRRADDDRLTGPDDDTMAEANKTLQLALTALHTLTLTADQKLQVSAIAANAKYDYLETVGLFEDAHLNCYSEMPPPLLEPLGCALLALGRYGEAACVYERLVAWEPANRPGHLSLAICYWRQKKLSGAHEIFLDLEGSGIVGAPAASLSDFAFRNHVRNGLAVVCGDLHRHAEALEYCNKGIADVSSVIDHIRSQRLKELLYKLWHNKAVALAALDEYDQSLKAGEMAVEKSRELVADYGSERFAADAARALLTRGRIRFRRTEFVMAYNDFLSSCNQVEEQGWNASYPIAQMVLTESLIEKSRVLSELKRLSDAEADATKALELAGLLSNARVDGSNLRQSFAYEARANIRGLQQGRKRQCIQDLQESLELRLKAFSEDASGHELEDGLRSLFQKLLVAHDERAERLRRIEILERWVDVFPDDAVALNDLSWELTGRLHEHLISPQRSLVLARTALRLCSDGDKPAVLDTLAWALFANKEYATAIQTLEDAIGLTTDKWRKELEVSFDILKQRVSSSGG